MCALSPSPGELHGPLLCISVRPCRNYQWSPERLSLKNRKIRRLTQTYLKYHNPGIPNVVKVDGTLVRVGVASAAHVVVLVPVHTHATDVELLPDWIVIIIIILVQTALMASLLQRRYFMTAHNSIVSWQRADKGHLIIFLWLVIRGQDNVTLAAKEPTVKFPVTNSFLSISDTGGAGSPHSDIRTALGKGFPGLFPQEKGKNHRISENQQISRVSPSFQSFSCHHITLSQITQSACMEMKKSWNAEICSLITLPINIKIRCNGIKEVIRLYCNMFIYVTADGHVL